MRIPVADVVLDADVVIPEAARGLVVFAHGSGSGRHSPRNRYVAGELQRAGLGTVLADLLTPEEERVDAGTAEFRFDIGLLAERVTGLVDRLAEEWKPAPGIGLFGASTGAATALVAAAHRPDTVQAVVSRGGRPDLAGGYLEQGRQPTLLIVGERDRVVIDLNRLAADRLPGPPRPVVVPAGTPPFGRPGAVE